MLAASGDVFPAEVAAHARPSQGLSAHPCGCACVVARVHSSLIDNVLSYNNYGPGLYACSFGDYNGSIMNNYGWNENNTIRNSQSLGDGYGRKFSSLSVFPTQVPLTNLLFENIVVRGHHCRPGGPGLALGDSGAASGLLLLLLSSHVQVKPTRSLHMYNTENH
jgi:hypothetical protein